MPNFGRKVRVMAGGLRSVWAMRQLLNPVRYGFYALQLWTHKVLRRGMVIPLILLGLSAFTLKNEGLDLCDDTLQSTRALGPRHCRIALAPHRYCPTQSAQSTALLSPRKRRFYRCHMAPDAR